MFKHVSTGCIIIILSLLLAACGGGASQDTRIASIKIVPGAVMLTRVGEQRALRAQAYNAAGDEVDATFSWSSSHPDQVAIDANGMLTAQTLGSAEIKATADGVASESALVLMTLPVANARLITDEQIVGDFAPVDPTMPYGLGFQYTVTLRGVDLPQVGEVLLGTGEAPLGGRVVAVTQNGQDVVVTLEIIPLPEMFDRLALNEAIDLSNAPVTIPQEVADYYDVKTNPDGSLLFTLKAKESGVLKQSARGNSAARAIGTFANPFHPFVCDFPGVSFFKLDTLSPTITLERNLSLPIIYDESTGELRKLSLKGAVKAEFKLTNTLTAQFETKGNCKLELTRITIPVGGPLALVFGGQVPVGVGFEVAGKVTFAGAGFVLGGKAETTAELGISCPPASSCGMINTFDVKAEAKPEWVMPNGFNPDAQLRFEPSLYSFVFAKLSLGPSSTALARFLSALNIDAFEFTAGGKVGANLAPVEGQVLSANYASDYKWSFDIKAGPSQTIDKLLGMIDVSLVKAEYTASEIIATSPGASLVKADVDAFNTGDVINFTVKLDPTTVNFFPFLYNVDEVLIYRKVPLAGGGATVEPVARATAADGQIDFSLSWVATEPGSTAGNFFAFVSTKLLPIPLLGELELKPVGRNSGKIAFVSDRDGTYKVYVMNTDGSNPVNLAPQRVDPGAETGQGLIAAWSPDDSKIAFIGTSSSGYLEIFVVNADGSNQINLTQKYGYTRPHRLAWSPDGLKIAFEGMSVRRGTSTVYVMNADGSNLVDLNIFSSGGRYESPVWSPDSSKIALSASLGDGMQIYVVNADGSNPVNLTQGIGISLGMAPLPSWSPDGTKIAFANGVPSFGPVSDIYVMNADGSNPINLTQGIGRNANPVWSPDSSKIAFERHDSFGTPSEIYVMNADGSNPVNLTQNPAHDRFPSWSPDGTRIAFQSSRGLNSEIYVMSADGSNLVNLTQNPANDAAPVWSP